MSFPKVSMTNCPGEDLLLDYMAGRLDAARSAVFERHTAQCEHCAAFRTAQSAVWRALDEWKAAPVSEGFNRELWRRIDADESRSTRIADVLGFSLWKRVAPLVFAAGVLVTAFVLDHSGRPDATPVPAAKAAIVVTASDADQLEGALDDIQLLHEVDVASAAANPKSGLM